MEEAFSIIVPIYNMEKYLEQCIDSVLNQSYEKWELILVDDGSIDSSSKICDKYERLDNRVKVIHQKNMGVSVARNIGIEEASYEYIAFIDPDDYYETDYLESVRCLANKFDLVMTNAWKMEEGRDSKFEYVGSIEGYEIEDSNIGVLRKRTLNPYTIISKNNKLPLFATPWMKIYKKSIIETNRIRFVPNLHPLEDVIFNFEYISKIRSFKFVDIPYYHYRIHEMSVTNSFRNDRYENFNQGYKYLRNLCYEDDEIRNDMFVFGFINLRSAVELQSLNHKFIKKYRKRKQELLLYRNDTLIQEICDCVNLDNTSLWSRIWLLLYKYRMVLFLDIFVFFKTKLKNAS